MKKFASNLILSFILTVSMSSESPGGTMLDYTSTPPFLSGRVTPNVLLLIDNSASMYDLAYVDEAGQEYCYDDTYNDANNYAGYFERDTWYKYDLAVGQFESTTLAAAAAVCDAATGTNYGNTYVCITIDDTPDPDEVTAFAAKGNLLNWAAASKLDIEKEILTGGKYEATGKYGAPNGRLVMESRGCLNRRLVKQVAVTSGAGTYYLTLGIRPPQEESFPAWTADTAYQIGDIVTDMGDLFIATAAGTSKATGLGVADDTCEACPTWAAYTLTRWTAGAYYPANSIVSDNGKMYITATGGTASGTGVANDAGITDWVTYDVTQIEIFAVTANGFDNTGCQAAIVELAKESPNQGQLKGYIDDCMGYSGGGSGSANAAFNHSIHNCWYESKHDTWPPGSGPVSSIKPACESIYTAGTDPWEITTDDEGYVCFGVYNADPLQQHGYVGRCWKPGAGSFQCTKYHPQHPDDPDYCQKWEWVGGDAPAWDAAGYADVGACISAALMDYCGILEIPEVIDPTDQAGETGEFWNIPAVLIDSGVVAQTGEPLAVLKGYIEQSAPPTGLAQEFADDLRIGAMTFNYDGSDSECSQPDPYILYDCADPANRDGGKIISYIDYGDTMIGAVTHADNLASEINKIKATSWTPIAEAMFNAIGYYTQDSARRLHADDFFVGASYDPITAWCQFNNILIITDGASTADLNTTVSNFVNTSGHNDGADGDPPAACGSLSGSRLLDDLTWYAKHGTDLYAAQLDGHDKYNITTHIVVAGTLRVTGADECSPDVLLGHAASNAGTSLYQATNPSELEDKIREAFKTIIGDATSGTAASVVSASRRGEGAIYQAVFFPTYTDDQGTEITWIGQLHAMFVDEYGNMREDTNGNATLDMTSDKIIQHFFDDTEGRTRARRDTDSDGNGEADGSPETIELSGIQYIWEAGKSLAARGAPTTRAIHTSIGGAWTEFKDTNKTALRPYLAQGTDADAEKLINYIRGTDQEGYRSRTINVDGTDRVWKLGDIIYSTPSLVGKPEENYDIIYADADYRTFKNDNNNRRNVVYVGANDGMLHAFNAGFYDESTKQFTAGAGKTLGEELWAFIPYNLLPHLRWLADENYSHVYYVDLKPKVIDAKIFTADADHAGGWGTVLICGMCFGGGPIELSETDVNYDWNGDLTIDPGVSRTFRSAYFALDVTNPEASPSLLWEFTDTNLGFTTSYPAVVSIDRTTTPDTWAIAFGSGPTDYDGSSTQTAKAYVVNLKTGVQIGSSLTTGGINTFMGDPISVDIDLSSSQCIDGTTCSYSPDVAYIGSSEGKFYRITGITSSSAGTASLFLDLADANKPIISAPSASQDDDGRLWLYFGTGRFFSDADKATTHTQSLAGVKEPLTDYADSTSLSYAEVNKDNLLDVTNYSVFEGGYIDTNGDLSHLETTFAQLVDNIKQTTADTDTPKHYDGWIVNLTGGERCITKPTVLGGIITFSTFEPDDDLCAFEGESFLYGLYYKTGTAYYESIIGYGDDTITVGADICKEISRAISLGQGVAATPSLHVGTKQGAKAFVQSSAGEIVVIEQENLPEGYKSRPLHWIQPTD